jgi:hypothetical protein
LRKETLNYSKWSSGWKSFKRENTCLDSYPISKKCSEIAVSIVLGRGGYEIYNVHSDKTLLSIEDEKAGKVSGGTDIIVDPYGVTEESVAIEVKSTKTVREKNGCYML